MTILIKLVFRTFLYYLINWNYLVCDSVLLSQTEWVISTYCWLGRSALSDIRASPQLGHLAQDAAHWRTAMRYLRHRSGVCDTALPPRIKARGGVTRSLSFFVLSFSSIVVLCSFIVYITLPSFACFTVDINCTWLFDRRRYLTGSRPGIVYSFVELEASAHRRVGTSRAMNPTLRWVCLLASRSTIHDSKLRLAV